MQQGERLRVLVACEFSGTVRDAFAAWGHQAVSCDLLPTETPGLHYQGDILTLLDGWMPVSFTADCDPDGDDWCQVSNTDPERCPCIGPTQDGIEYMEKDGELFGRPENHPHWDLMIAHPPCTYLSVSGLHWNKRVPGRAEKTEEALRFVQTLMDAQIKRICVENPISCISSRIRKPDQIIQPWQFGHRESKSTCLWLKGLPPLVPTQIVNAAKATCKDCGKSFELPCLKGCPYCKSQNFKLIYDNMTPSGQNKLGPSPTRAMERSRTYQGIANAMADQWGAVCAF